MTREPTMTKSITTSTLDADLQQLIRAAGEGKIRMIFEEDGKPVAAVMPVLSAQTWEAERDAFFATFEETAKRADLSEEEAEELALEAVRAVRSGAS